MGKIIRTLLALALPPGQSAFLWGPRQVGKSSWVRESRRMAHGQEVDFVLGDMDLALEIKCSRYERLRRRRVQLPDFEVPRVACGSLQPWLIPLANSNPRP
jgi:predicted AAA+ superfamily ATPase